MRTRSTTKKPSKFIKKSLTKRPQHITTLAKADMVKKMELAEVRKCKAAESTERKTTSNGKQKTNGTTTQNTNNTTNNNDNPTWIDSDNNDVNKAKDNNTEMAANFDQKHKILYTMKLQTNGGIQPLKILQKTLQDWFKSMTSCVNSFVIYKTRDDSKSKIDHH